jgi:hypothetical protein
MTFRARLAVPAILCVSLASAGVGHAAPAPPPTASVRLGSGTLFFTDASAGSEQRLSIQTITRSGRRFVELTDTGPFDLQASTGCTHESSGVVLCPATDVTLTRVSLGKLDDQMRIIGGIAGGGKGAAIGAILAEGNEGDDAVAGGPADDNLDGGPGDDVLDGGEGADVFVGGPGIDTADFSRRGPASVVRVTLGDEEVDGDRQDLLEGALRPTDIKKLSAFAAGTITLGTPAPPPAPRVGDDVRGDVENVVGGAGGDDLVGNGAANVLAGGPGPDELEGKAGADSYAGGDGDDLLLTRDGAVDAAISCGTGADRVVSDPQDVPGSDCETVDNGAAPGEAPGGAVAATAPQAEIVTRLVQVSRAGVARLRIRCVYRAATCRGPVKITAAAGAQVRIGRRLLRVRAGQTLASRVVNVPWGTSQGIVLQVGSTARQVIARRARGLRARATATLSDSGGTAGPPARVTRAVALVRAPARARR